MSFFWQNGRFRPKSSDIVRCRHRCRSAFHAPSGRQRTSDSEGYKSPVHSMQPMPWGKFLPADAASREATCRKTRFVKLFLIFSFCTTYSISPISVQSISEVGKWVSAGRRSAGWVTLPVLWLSLTVWRYRRTRCHRQRKRKRMRSSLVFVLELKFILENTLQGHTCHLQIYKKYRIWPNTERLFFIILRIISNQISALFLRNVLQLTIVITYNLF